MDEPVTMFINSPIADSVMEMYRTNPPDLMEDLNYYKFEIETKNQPLTPQQELNIVQCFIELSVHPSIRDYKQILFDCINLSQLRFKNQQALELLKSVSEVKQECINEESKQEYDEPVPQVGVSQGLEPTITDVSIDKNTPSLSDLSSILADFVLSEVQDIFNEKDSALSKLIEREQQLQDKDKELLDSRQNQTSSEHRAQSYRTRAIKAEEEFADLQEKVKKELSAQRLDHQILMHQTLNRFDQHLQQKRKEAEQLVKEALEVGKKAGFEQAETKLKQERLRFEEAEATWKREKSTLEAAERMRNQEKYVSDSAERRSMEEKAALEHQFRSEREEYNKERTRIEAECNNRLNQMRKDFLVERQNLEEVSRARSAEEVSRVKAQDTRIQIELEIVKRQLAEEKDRVRKLNDESKMIKREADALKEDDRRVVNELKKAIGSKDEEIKSLSGEVNSISSQLAASQTSASRLCEEIISLAGLHVPNEDERQQYLHIVLSNMAK